MVTKRVEFDVPDGQHLGESHDTDGTHRGLLFDDKTNKLVGHAEFREIDDEDEECSCTSPAGSDEPDLGGALVVLAFLGVTIGAVAGVQHARNRREQRKAQRAALDPPAAAARAQRALPPPSPEQRVPSATQVSQAPAAQMAVTRPEGAVTMTRAEWEERVRAMLLARAFSEEQQRILSHAQIADADPEMLEWQRAFDSLTPQQFSERITLMLEANPALLTEAEARFMALFGPGRAPERERVPVRAAPVQALAAVSATAPAGWYDVGRGGLRWWNGQAWTQHVRPAHASARDTQPSTNPPGWYSDGTGWLRWWDGGQWTAHVAPLPGTRPR